MGEGWEQEGSGDVSTFSADMATSMGGQRAH